jgi:hypothetical protein
MNAFLIIETILRNRFRFFADLRANNGVPAKCLAMLASSAVFFALYGAVIGSSHSALQALSSAIKLPIVFLLTLVVTLPTLYFFNLLYGSGLNLGQNFALILTAVTVTGVLLLSFAPVVLFFLTTSSNYQFFKLLNVAIFAITGVVGVQFLAQASDMMGNTDRQGILARRRLVRFWIILYAFVGTQLAWTLRPFFGAPELPFELFRDLGGTFYANIFASLGEILGFFSTAGGM